MLILPDRPGFGIYAIRHLPTDVVYVGQTARPFIFRWLEHLTDLVRGEHICASLQAQFQFDGLSAFSIEVLEEVSELACLLEREAYWIARFQPYVFNKGRIVRGRFGPPARSGLPNFKSLEGKAIIDDLLTSGMPPTQIQRRVGGRVQDVFQFINARRRELLGVSEDVA